jgi:isopenicillin-N N-acyltransferase like protein
MSFVIASVKGTPGDMGLMHGEAAKELIEETVSVYESLAATQPGALERAIANLGPYVDASNAVWPDLAAEVEGLARGAGIDRDMAWILNCMEEVWPAESCVTMSSGPFLMHAEQWFAGHKHVVLLCAEPDDGPPFLSPTNVGFLPAVGISAAGFAQGIDGLTARDDGPGIPRVLVSRRALGAGSLNEAVEAASHPSRAGGYAHALKSLERSVVVETTAHRSDVLPDVHAHTNHYLSDELQSIGDESSRGSMTRLARATELVEHDPPRTLEECTALLSDHGEGSPSTCLHGSPRDGETDVPDPASTATVFGMACDLSTGRMLVSEGRPCSTRWHEMAVPDYASARPARVG